MRKLVNGASGGGSSDIETALRRINEYSVSFDKITEYPTGLDDNSAYNIVVESLTNELENTAEAYKVVQEDFLKEMMDGYKMLYQTNPTYQRSEIYARPNVYHETLIDDSFLRSNRQLGMVQGGATGLATVVIIALIIIGLLIMLMSYVITKPASFYEGYNTFRPDNEPDITQDQLNTHRHY